MTSSDKKLELVFAPGCFDSFEGTQEELNELVEQIKQAFESGELMENSTPVDDLDIDESDADEIISAMQQITSDGKRNLH